MVFVDIIDFDVVVMKGTLKIYGYTNNFCFLIINFIYNIIKMKDGVKLYVYLRLVFGNLYVVGFWVIICIFMSKQSITSLNSYLCLFYRK